MVHGDRDAHVGNGDQNDVVGAFCLAFFFFASGVHIELGVVGEIHLDGSTANDGVLHGVPVIRDQLGGMCHAFHLHKCLLLLHHDEAPDYVAKRGAHPGNDGHTIQCTHTNSAMGQ
jgi:hypothetical protein